MKKLSTALLITGVALAGCAGAPAEDPEGLVAENVLVEDYVDDPVVCRRQRVAGSHVPVRVCKTESQMKAERDGLQKTIGPLRPMTGDGRRLDIQTIPNN
ncbi:MAG: hypothetical protein OEV41_11540 [Gammaproteobacteria bacterium]|nr:hypothetical protein [Gammaproteobacteria bacterium]MDH5344217.1 hypothetical protein [Gammaproteobacteria bacterium]